MRKLLVEAVTSALIGFCCGLLFSSVTPFRWWQCGLAAIGLQLFAAGLVGTVKS